MKDLSMAQFKAVMVWKTIRLKFSNILTGSEPLRPKTDFRRHSPAKSFSSKEKQIWVIKIHPNQKALIASGYSETEDVRIARKLGAGEYIKKPYTIEKIGIAIKERLNK